MKCLFIEPWIGQCPGDVAEHEICCEKHSKEKCQVCGEQATTRCQASRGLMCGIPLCSDCGAGEMCLYHASSGPLMVIKALLGGGPEPTVMATRDTLTEQANKMATVAERLKHMKFSPTIEEFNKTKEDWNKE